MTEEDISQELYDDMMRYGQRGIAGAGENELTVRKAMKIWNLSESGTRTRLDNMVRDGVLSLRRNVPLSGTSATINVYTYVRKNEREKTE